ncbi:fimbrial protein [Pseudomonas sp. SIMBA_068]
MPGQANLTVPLAARYVQTGSKITPGSANARATFTMSYQ